MCYLATYNQQKHSWQQFQGKIQEVKSLDYVIVCTNHHNNDEQHSNILSLPESYFPSYKLGIVL